jgi:hypothetical protein
MFFGYSLSYDKKVRAEKNYIDQVTYMNSQTVSDAKLHINILTAIEEGKYDLAKNALKIVLKNELDGEFNPLLGGEEKLLKKAKDYQKKYCENLCLGVE